MESQNRNDETVKVIDLTTSEKKLNELDNKLKHITIDDKLLNENETSETLNETNVEVNKINENNESINQTGGVEKEETVENQVFDLNDIENVQEDENENENSDHEYDVESNEESDSISIEEGGGRRKTKTKTKTTKEESDDSSVSESSDEDLLSSVSSSEQSDDEDANGVLLDPLYHIMTQFFETEDNVNIADSIKKMTMAMLKMNASFNTQILGLTNELKKTNKLVYKMCEIKMKKKK